MVLERFIYMLFQQDRRHKYIITALTKIIVLATIIVIAIFYLSYLNIPRHYNIISIAYSYELFKHGHINIPTSIDWHRYWGDAVEVEKLYPTPALLHLIFITIAGIPWTYAGYIPLVFVLTIAFYVFPWKLMQKIRKNSEFPKSFSAFIPIIYYAYVVYLALGILYSGRAHWGTLLPVFIIYALILMDKTNVKSWFTVLTLFALLLSITYYTASFAVFFAGSLILFLSSLTSHTILEVDENEKKGLVIISLIIILAIFLLNPFLGMEIKREGLTIRNYLHQVLSLFTMGALERKTQAYVYKAVAGYDPITFILKRVEQIVKGVSVISVYLYSFLYIILKALGGMKKNMAKKLEGTIFDDGLVAFLSMFILLMGIGSKLFYRGLEFRFETLFGLPIALLLAYDIVKVFTKKSVARNSVNLVLYSLFFLIIISCIGAFMENYLYGVDPTTRFYTSGFSQYLAHVEGRIVVYSDMATSSDLLFKLEVRNLTSYVSPTPYINRRIVQLLSNASGCTDIEELEKMQVQYVFYFSSFSPIKVMGAEMLSGEGFFKLSPFVVRQETLLYNAGRAVLLKLGLINA